MSPVSRRRRPAKKKRTAARPRPPLPSLHPAEEPDPPDDHSDDHHDNHQDDHPADRRADRRADPSPHEPLEDLLSDASDLSASDDPWLAEQRGAAVVELAERRGSQEGDRERTLLDEVIPLLEERADASAAALLLAVGAVASGEAGHTATAAAGRLLAAGAPRPPWADELAEPVGLDECWRVALPTAKLSLLGAVCRRAERSRAFLVVVNEAEGGAAIDIMSVAPQRLAGAMETIAGTEPRDDLKPTRTEVDPDEFRRLVVSALDARAEPGQDDEFPETGRLNGPPFRVLAAVVRANLSPDISGHAPSPVT
ncbi:hypothetical protein [Pseudonocardia acaciae]|uniref:hypothetical protein n=1 Tax=Pseudonocardia acaciae TaxID=551276 RepID=UPI00048AD6F7|nr:hypothetical protein [Pseudonocardia acaciae]